MGILLALAGPVMGLLGANSQASALDAQAKAQQQQTNIAVNAERRQNAKVLAKQEAIGAASGLDTSTGTPLEMALDTAYTGELNALNLKNQGQMRVQSLKAKARSTRTAGLFNAIGGAISNSGTFLSQFLKP